MDFKLFLIFIPLINADPKCGIIQTWIDFKDQKSFILLSEPANRNTALSKCAALKSKEENQAPLLAQIKTREEQFFLNNLLFKSCNLSDRIWIGAKRIGSSKNFTWENKEDLNSYSNWVSGSPSNNAAKSCVILNSSKNIKSQSDVGKWEDVSCDNKNLILCQKIKNQNQAPKNQNPTQSPKITTTTTKTPKNENSNQAPKNDNLSLDQKFKKLESDFNELSNQLKNTNIFGKISGFEGEVSKFNRKFSGIESDMSRINKKMPAIDEEIIQINASLNNISVELPKIQRTLNQLSFVYFQIGLQTSPKRIWPSYTWTDISPNYSGLFFRVTGNEAATMGTTQEENAPRITQTNFGHNVPTLLNVTLNPGSWSVFLRTGYHPGGHFPEGVKFFTSGGEVRPRNTAMKVWKRER